MVPVSARAVIPAQVAAERASSPDVKQYAQVA